MRAIGKPLTLVSTEESFDPQLGRGVTLHYKGTQSAMRSNGAALAAAGFKTNVFNEGATWCLDAFAGQNSPNDSTPEVPVDRWELNAEFVQEDFWNSPRVHQLAAGILGISLTSNTNLFANSPTADNLVAQWKRACQSALKGTDSAGGPLTTEEADTAGIFQKITMGVVLSDSILAAKLLYLFLLRGQVAWETRRPLLHRVRSISLKYAGQFVLPPTEIIYSTDALVRVFAIPVAIANRLPGWSGAVPANPISANPPVATVWSWKQRASTSSIILALNKVEEVHEWVFSAWSLVHYDYIAA